MTTPTQVDAPPVVRMVFTAEHHTIPDVLTTLGAIDDLWVTAFALAIYEHPTPPPSPQERRAALAAEALQDFINADPNDTPTEEFTLGRAWDPSKQRPAELPAPDPVVPRPERTGVSLASPLVVELSGDLLGWATLTAASTGAVIKGVWSMFTWLVEHADDLGKVRERLSGRQHVTHTSDARQTRGEALTQWFPHSVGVLNATDAAAAGETLAMAAEGSAVSALRVLANAGVGQVTSSGVHQWTPPG